MTLQLWGQEIQYDEKVVSLVEFSSFLEQRAKRSAEDFLRIGVKKKIGWLNDGTEFLEAEMRRACDDIGIYITQHNILGVPNWNMYLEPWVALAESSKVLMKNLHYSLINECNNEVQERANQAYRQSLANSEGLGFGIISSSLAAHLVYAVQSAQKEAENERAAQAAAEAVRRNSDVIGKAGELTTKAYHETHEPFVLETLTSFYDNVESFIYTGAGYSKGVINEQTKAAAEVVQSTTGDIRSNIILALRKDICCGEVILAAITEKLVDDGFVDFCENAPIILLRKSVKPIVEWLSKEKRTNQLYNRPVFSEKIQAFLVATQKLFLCGDTNKHNLYENILSEVFADEINGTYSACYDLLKGKAIVEKYANSGTHISLSNTTVNMLVMLCNQIRSNSIVDLVRTAGLTLPLDAKQIVSLQEETNIAISNRSHEIMCAKAEAAAKAAAEKAEKERIAAEARAKKQEADARNRQQNVKRMKVAAVIAVPVVIIALLFSQWLLPDVIQPAIAYSRACALMEKGNYQDAIEVFESIDGYRDSEMQIQACKTAMRDAYYNEAMDLIEQGLYRDAIDILQKLSDHRDSETQILACETAILDGFYNEAVSLMEQGLYQDAALLFEITARYQYKDSDDKVKRIVTVLIDRSKASTISAGFSHVVGLRNDGTVVATGSNSSGQCNTGSWKSIIAVSAGGYHTVGIKADGTVVATGSNEHGQCNVSGWNNIVAIYAGSYHTIGLKSDGSVVVAGIYYYYQSGELLSTHTWPKVSDWRDIYAVGAGNNFSVVIRDDHTVIAVGDNDYGQCNTATWTNIYAISVSSGHTVGLKSDGTVVATGIDFRNHGQCDVGKWNYIIAITAGSYHTVGLQVNGKVVAVGYNEYGQCDISNWENVVAIAAGSDFTVALLEDGSVVAVGNNENGQCNVSEWTDIRIPN